MSKKMTFKEALKKLGISKYEKRIFNSNSHGELSHLHEYILIAKHLKKDELKKFTKWFESLVKDAEKTWLKPESVFQHVLTLMTGRIK